MRGRQEMIELERERERERERRKISLKLQQSIKSWEELHERQKWREQSSSAKRIAIPASLSKDRRASIEFRP
jgi:hypothetical protein